MPFLKHRIVTILSGLIFASILLVYGCGRNEKPKEEEILVRVGDSVITTAEYKEELTMLPPNYRNIADMYKDQFLESLISKRLLLQEAKRKNLENSEAVKKFTQRAKEEIMIQELINTEVANKAEVTDSEIEEHYNENQNNYMELAKMKASHILVDSEVIAIKVLHDLKNGVDFAELAKEYSLDIPTKDKGGELQYFAKGQLFPEFEQACEKLEIGEVSEAVKTGLGYHIIKVLDKKEAKAKTLEEVKDTIKNELVSSKQTLLYENLLQDLKKNQPVSINNELLQTLTQ